MVEVIKSEHIHKQYCIYDGHRFVGKHADGSYYWTNLSAAYAFYNIFELSEALQAVSQNAQIMEIEEFCIKGKNITKDIACIHDIIVDHNHKKISTGARIQ